MAFQIKDFRSIVASMVNWMRSTQTQVTDFNVGGVARTMLEAPAIEIEQLYLQMFIGLREAIPVAVYNTFGFDPLPAAKASGTITFTTAAPASSPILINAGTIVGAPSKDITYVTTADATIPVGQTFVQVLAAADTPGSIGNTGADTVTTLVSSVSGISTVTNSAPIINGRDQETDADRLSRFRDYIRSLARGTVSAVLYGVKTANLKDALGQVYEYVAMASLVEPWKTNPAQPVGLVNVYIHNGANAASGTLVAEAQRVVDGYYAADGTPVPGWKAAGVKVVVAAASSVLVDVTGTLNIDPTYTSSAVINDAKTAIRLYIQQLGVGVPVLLSELVAIIKRDVPGVLNVHLTVPSADVAITVSQKALAGNLTLTAA